MVTSDVVSVFVYGTLKRGQQREQAWPRKPIEVCHAYVLGELYDLGAYPALVPGADKVRGELWFLSASDIEPTLEVLDRIEGFRDSHDDLYSRVEVSCEVSCEPESIRAFTYWYQIREHLSPANRISASDDGFVQWP